MEYFETEFIRKMNCRVSAFVHRTFDEALRFAIGGLDSRLQPDIVQIVRVDNGKNRRVVGELRPS